MSRVVQRNYRHRACIVMATDKILVVYNENENAINEPILRVLSHFLNI